MKNDLISIIIPVYNHAHTLGRCLLSVEKQTYRQLEVIIVNDGSTDDFNKVIKHIKTRISIPIKVITQNNTGAAAARNRGFKEATGGYVIFWDADTVAKPEMLTKLKAALDRRPEASYAYSQFTFGWKTIKSQPFKVSDLMRVNYIDTTSIIRRSALASYPYQGEAGRGLPSSAHACGPFDESLKRFQDWDLWLTLAEQNKTGTFVPEVLFKKIVSGRKGISSWLPSFVYRLPWKTKKVKEYEAAKKKILRKHRLTE